MPRSSNEPLFAAVRAWLAAEYPGECCTEIKLVLHRGRVVLAVPAGLAPQPIPEDAFVPTAVQSAILAALDGKALRTDELGAVIGDKRRLYHAGGIKELRDLGLVELHKRLGYYRPDAPPPELNEEEP